MSNPVYLIPILIPQANNSDIAVDQFISKVDKAISASNDLIILISKQDNDLKTLAQDKYNELESIKKVKITSSNLSSVKEKAKLLFNQIFNLSRESLKRGIVRANASLAQLKDKPEINTRIRTQIENEIIKFTEIERRINDAIVVKDLQSAKDDAKAHYNTIYNLYQEEVAKAPIVEKTVQPVEIKPEPRSPIAVIKPSPEVEEAKTKPEDEFNKPFNKAKLFYDSGRYQDSFNVLVALLGAGKEYPPAQMVEIYKYLAFCYSAYDRMDLAKKQFKNALKYDPGLTLDPIFTAPKIMDVFNEAKNEFQKERPAAPIAGIKQEPSPTIKQVQPGPQNVCAAGACPAEEKPQSSSQSISLIGQKTPSFALRDISSGNFFYADELIGKKPFVLIFWHAGCGGCESVMPILNEIIESYKDKPLYKLPSIIGMAIQERARNLEFIKNNGISFQNLEDKYMLTFQKFNSKYTPAIIFIDKEGIVKNILVGSAINKFGLEEEISHLTEFDVNEGKKPDQIGIKSEGIPQRIVSLNSGLGLGDEQCIKTMAELDAVIDRAMESAMNSDEVKKTFKGMGIKGEISFTFFVQQDGKLSIKTVSTNVLNKFIMPIVNALPEKITPLSPKGIANPGSQGIVEWETPPIKIERTIKITPGV